MKLIRILVILLVLACTSCGGGGGGGSATKFPSIGGGSTGAVEGYVYVPVGSGARFAEASAAQPGYQGLGSATVMAACGATSKIATTDAGTDAGHFRIEGLPAGSCTLTVKKSGYTDVQTTVSVIAGVTASVGTSGLSMKPTVSGAVSISDNIPGATIYIDGINTNLNMDDTTYGIGNLSPGNHTVALSMAGFLPVATQTVAITTNATATASFMLVGKNNKIAFSSNRNSDFVNDDLITELFTMNPDGTDQKQVATIHGNRPSVSQDGTFILYQQTASAPDLDTTCQVFKVNIDGTDNHCLINRDSIGGMLNVLSYDGKKIVYVSAPTDCTAPPPGPEFYCNDIYIMNVDGTNRTRVTTAYGNDGGPSISPDGKKIVFVSSRDSLTSSDIYIINIDGKNEKRLTNDGHSTYPSFSPDGSKIVFASGRDGVSYDIYTMNIDGSNPIRLTTNTKSENTPKYSPDGKKITFVVFVDVNYQNAIYVMNADGTNQQRLTFTQWGNEEPSWTP